MYFVTSGGTQENILWFSAIDDKTNFTYKMEDKRLSTFIAYEQFENYTFTLHVSYYETKLIVN